MIGSTTTVGVTVCTGHGPLVVGLGGTLDANGTREYGALRVNHDLTQDEIAQLVGSSRETVNKVLAECANHGWICLRGRRLLISDYESLARRARYPTPPGPYNTHRPMLERLRVIETWLVGGRAHAAFREVHATRVD
jgi:hypothetical protein